MGLVKALLRPQASGDPNDERFWSHGFGNIASSGIVVNPDTAMRTSAVWACVRLISESVAMLPLLVYKRVGDTGRKRATNLPLYSLLHDQPNPLQTSMEFREMLTAHALLRGNGYAQIVPGPSGPFDQLVPLHPDNVEPQSIPSGGIRYKVRQDDGTDKMLNQDQVFHLRGLSFDGIKGLSVLEYARESFGLAIATEQYGARLFSQDASPGGVLQHPGKLSQNAALRLKESWEQAHAGLQNAHRIAVLEEGLTWQKIGMTNEDAQFLATREFQIEDIARWFRVPLHLISSTTKATSFGAGIEEMGSGFVTYTLMPWLCRWEQTISRDLILDPDNYFVEFLVDMLLRAKTLERYQAYQIASGGTAPWMARNEIRERENLNPLDGLDEVLQPTTMAPIGENEPEPSSPSPSTPAQNPMMPEDGGKAYLRLLVYEAANRVLRKEAAVLGKAAKRYAGDASGWHRAVDEFYSEHPVFVAETMKMPLRVAQQYVDCRRIHVDAEGASAVDNGSPEILARLVLGEPK